MASSIVRRTQAGDTSPRPAAFLVDAMAAVLDGEPDRPIALTQDVYVRAAYIVEQLAPEALERAGRHTRGKASSRSQSART